MVDGRYLGNRINRRYGGGSRHTAYPPNLHLPRPGSYAYKSPFDNQRTSYYPIHPQIVSYQDRVHQKQKLLDIFIDHSGHVDADSSLFPHPNDIPTVLIPSNARALEPAVRVFPHFQGFKPPLPPSSPPQPSSSLHSVVPPLLPPSHAHISLMHPSYESGFNQHHHNEINEVSYAYTPLEAAGLNVPPSPAKNYLDVSNSYASVVHSGGSYLNGPHQTSSAENPSTYTPSLSISASSYYPQILNPVSHQQPPVESPQSTSLPFYPGHFSHNNPLGIVTCCDNSWSPLKPVPTKEDQHLHPPAKDPMSIYLPVVSHDVGAESQAFSTILSLGTHSNGTLHSSNNITLVVLESNRTVSIQNGSTAKLPTTNKIVRLQRPKAIPGTKETPPKTTILMLMPQNSTGEAQSDPLPPPSRPFAIKFFSTTTVRPTSSRPNSVTTPAPSSMTRPAVPNQPAADVGQTGSLAQSSGGMTSADGGGGIMGVGSVSSESSSASIPGSPAASDPVFPQATRPASSPPVADDEIIGIPGDLIPVEPAADPASEGGGNGLVNVFTQFLDELANIIETFSPTELPAADPGLASDPGVGGLGETGQSLTNAAVQGAGEGANAIGSGVESGVGGLTEGTSGLVSGGSAGIDGASGIAEGIGSGANVGQGLGGVGNEVSAASQLSASVPGQDFGLAPLLPNRDYTLGELNAYQTGIGQGAEFVAQSASSSQFPMAPLGQGQPTPLYLNPMNFPQFGASFVRGVHSSTGDVGDPEPHPIGEPVGHPEEHPIGEPPGPEPFHMDVPAAEVHHVESEPIPESNTLVHDHFVEIPMSEVAPSPEFVPNDSQTAAAEAEPHPQASNTQHYNDRPFPSYKDSFRESGRQNFQSYNADTKIEQDALNADSQMSALSSDHHQAAVQNGPMMNPGNFQLLRYTDSLLYPLGPAINLPPMLVPQVPEVIAASSAVRHYTQGRYPTPVPEDTLPTIPETPPPPPPPSPLISRNESILNSYQNLNFNPEAEINVRGEIGQLSDANQASHMDYPTEEASTVREYITEDNSIKAWGDIPDQNAFPTNSFDREEDNFPDAEGIPANIIQEVQTNMNLDLLKTRNK